MSTTSPATTSKLHSLIVKASNGRMYQVKALGWTEGAAMQYGVYEPGDVKLGKVWATSLDEALALGSELIEDSIPEDDQM